MVFNLGAGIFSRARAGLAAMDMATSPDRRALAVETTMLFLLLFLFG